jgi:hypothetical protein
METRPKRIRAGNPTRQRVIIFLALFHVINLQPGLGQRKRSLILRAEKRQHIHVELEDGFGEGAGGVQAQFGG